MLALVVVVGSLGTVLGDQPVERMRWWDARVATSLDCAPAKRPAWEQVLAATPEAERTGMAYLVANLPQRDLETLAPDVLAKNCALAYRARRLVPWGPRLPEEIFLDAVLPHACLTEPRDPMRAEFLEHYLPLVKDCKSPGEAACRINERLFKDYNVRYNTRRLRTDQCSRESIAQGMATCTGLSLMLVEACRAVAVPARVALIASWPEKGGNHTWVEVWDDCGWHFLGAAEPDPAGLNHAWFAADAAKAIEDRRENAIWAITYRKTGQNTPLVWAPRADVPGENVTHRYAATKAAAGGPPEKSASEELAARLRARFGPDPGAARQVAASLEKVPWEPSMRALAWRAYKESPRHDALRKEFDAKRVSTPERTSEYLWREIGKTPEGGWPLVIAMHGGGGAPKAVNDGQWKRMFESYYRDRPESGGYIYLALRAPNDLWNGFHDDAICPLVERLIRQFVLFRDVEPNRVYALGASHGGYGAFVIGPKMPDRFAAVHASAAAPTDGETQGENLRNLRFTFMVGERDTDYGRSERCQKFARLLEGWRGARGGYPGAFEWKSGVGHSVPDRDKVAELLATRRDSHPSRVVWVQSDAVLKHFYWLDAAVPADGGRIEATIVDNRLTIKAHGQDRVALWLDAPLVDFSRQLTIEIEGGKTSTVVLTPTLETFCRGLEERSDPDLAAPARVELSLIPQGDGRNRSNP
jgi:poly(3-hydroxybutyrate) depolymerase